MSRPSWADRLDWNSINPIAQKYRLDPNVVAAVIQTESAGNIYAIRAEARKLMSDTGKTLFLSLWNYFYEADHFAQLINSSQATEWVGQLIGWGPMQVQGAVAREHGFTGWYPQICSWDVGVEYGCKHLRRKADKYGDDPATLYAAYNAGAPRMMSTGMYINQRNVDNFMKKYREIAP